MDKELNLYDMFASIYRAFCRLLALCWGAVTAILLKVIRYWWLFVPIVGGTMAAMYYHTRCTTPVYNARAIAFLNGSSLLQFEQTIAVLNTPDLLPEDAAIKPYLKSGVASQFTTFYVVDALGDEREDYVDYLRVSRPADTLYVRMHDRYCLQFDIKASDIKQLPEIEEALMQTLNSNESLRKSYQPYSELLQEEVAFNHAQAKKLDSLTSCYYFNGVSNPLKNHVSENGVVNINGDYKVQLFLNEIYKHQQHLMRIANRIQFATAPVVLENHFYLEPVQVEGRKKAMCWAFIISFVISYVLSQMIAKRKALSAWLKQ